MKKRQDLDKINVEINYIRHGEVSLFNKSAKVKDYAIQDIYDSLALNNKGKLQAKSVAKELSTKIKKDEIIILLSSPIKRAQQTAKIIKSEFGKHLILIKEELVINFLRSAEGLDRAKNEYSDLNGNELFDKWITSSFQPSVTYLETYISVTNRYKRFLSYINELRLKYHKFKKLRVVAVAHGELPDYIMVKYFNNYGLKNCEILNIDIDSNNNALLSITGNDGGFKVKETLKNLLI